MAQPARPPASSLRKAIVNRPSSASRRHRVLLDGTGRLAVHSTFIVQSIHGGIQELAGIDRPEWLDLGWAVWDSNPEPRD